MSTLTSLLDEKASRIAEQVDDLGRDTAGRPGACMLPRPRFARVRKPSKTSRTVPQTDSTAPDPTSRNIM